LLSKANIRAKGVRGVKRYKGGKKGEAALIERLLKVKSAPTSFTGNKGLLISPFAVALKLLNISDLVGANVYENQTINKQFDPQNPLQSEYN
jgi:hypothetical protein